MNGKRGWWVAAALVFLTPAAPAAPPPAAPPLGVSEGVKACLDCHASPRVMGIAKTAHARRDNPETPAAQQGCESCHGPSLAHMQFPMQVENLNFGKKSKTEPKVQNEVCIVCHAKGAEQAEKDWRASAHGFEQVLCSGCHAIHDPTKIVPAKATVSSGCSTEACHATLMGDSSSTSFSHAVGKNIGDKGQVTCTECHNPHGPLNSGRCADCHPQTAEITSKQSEKARRFHEVAIRQGTECIRCHKALSHPIKPLQLKQQDGTIESLDSSDSSGTGG